MDKLTRFSISLPASLLEDFDGSLEARGYRTRSDAMRQLIRRFITESFWEEGDKSNFRDRYPYLRSPFSRFGKRRSLLSSMNSVTLLSARPTSMPTINTVSKALSSGARHPG